ncbi:hypothetical protein DMH04_41170 [Kibdelosporangium aridum]|uniref:Uncharacterized protein n=1 Tax=Kibdelosporangium aridum TaxID=2030 RepID=A0A428YUV3_KIBAR|nr:hypothetical protein [Kibdelosporangium aridum]RSM73425.1 hypothetical protein DMH04_41170 [Kibdelosporangium aridum]
MSAEKAPTPDNAGPTISLQRTTAIEPHHGGTVVYRVTLNGRWIGWVGDGRHWRGWRYGQRLWWACHREDGDTAARWRSELVHPTRASAAADLYEQVEGQE